MVSEFLHLPASPGEKICVALGVFDGVHLGHRKIIATLAKIAHEHNAKAVAMTFAPHPKAVLGGEEPPLLTPLDRRLELLKQAGAESVGVIEFTPEFAAMSPETFLHELLYNNGGCRICGIAVGSNWRFGSMGRGTPAMLTAAGLKEGFQFCSVNILTADEERISSSLIRTKEAAGELDEVRKLLGRNPELYGTVVRDLHIGSDKLGYPTANLALAAGVPPPNGVYAGLLDGMPAAINIGISPSVEANRQRFRIEAHVIGKTIELSDQIVRLELVQRVRGEIKFPSFDALKMQIKSDIAAINSILSSCSI